MKNRTYLLLNIVHALCWTGAIIGFVAIGEQKVLTPLLLPGLAVVSQIALEQHLNCRSPS